MRVQLLLLVVCVMLQLGLVQTRSVGAVKPFPVKRGLVKNPSLSAKKTGDITSSLGGREKKLKHVSVMSQSVEEMSRKVMSKCHNVTGNFKNRIGSMMSRIFHQKRNKISQREVKNKHLSARYNLASDSRLQKELRDFIQDPIDNVKLSVGHNIRQWIITMTGAEGTIYAGEKYRLKFIFPSNYPFSPPSVHFLHPIPKHEHVYTNGDICLNLLGPGWMPTMTAQGIAISILSMLSSAREKKVPPDNAIHADNVPGQQQVDWMYHDDKC